MVKSKVLLTAAIVLFSAFTSGGIWVGTIQGQVTDNSTHIEELDTTRELVIRIDERQVAMSKTLDRIEDALRD